MKKARRLFSNADLRRQIDWSVGIFATTVTQSGLVANAAAKQINCQNLIAPIRGSQQGGFTPRRGRDARHAGLGRTRNTAVSRLRPSLEPGCGVPARPSGLPRAPGQSQVRAEHGSHPGECDPALVVRLLERLEALILSEERRFDEIMRELHRYRFMQSQIVSLTSPEQATRKKSESKKIAAKATTDNAHDK